MPTLADLAHDLTPLTRADVEWLHALVSDWQLLADLSFADLVLWAPLRTGSGWVALAQMRPTTGPTALYDDMVGTVVAAGERPLGGRGPRRAAHLPGGRSRVDPGVPVRRESIPVTRDARWSR